jgi:hypothetical protein
VSLQLLQQLHDRAGIHCCGGELSSVKIFRTPHSRPVGEGSLIVRAVEAQHEDGAVVHSSSRRPAAFLFFLYAGLGSSSSSSFRGSRMRAVAADGGAPEVDRILLAVRDRRRRHSP